MTYRRDAIGPQFFDHCRSQGREMAASGSRDSDVRQGEGEHLASGADVRFQLSLFQVMKLMVFCAAAFAAVAPIVRFTAIRGAGGWGAGLFIYSLIAVPLVWALVSFALVRQGIWRDRVILSMLLCSVSVALAIATLSLVLTAGQLRIQSLLPFAAVTITLAAAEAFLAIRLDRNLRRSG